MKTFREDFFKFKQKLIDKQHFALARYSDGEMYILQNIELVLDKNLIKIGNNTQGGPYKPIDYKHFNPTEHSFYQQKLVESFKHRQFNYYKGISCSCCVGKSDFDWQIDLHGGDDESLTWANIWVNGNYALFIEEVFPILMWQKCVFVGNEHADISNLSFIVNDFRVGYNAMINDYNKIEVISKWIGDNNIKNHTFLFSASTFSNLAIYQLFSKYPDNTYIDIGTCLNKFINLPIDRSYLDGYWNKKPSATLNKICIWN